MQINNLKRIHPNKKRMIVARGGKRGKTAGRGGKGQSARAGNKRRPEWRDIIKKLPKLRGRGVNSLKSFAPKPIAINISVLETVFAANDSISPVILFEKGLISTESGRLPGVKILGDGEVTKALIISGCTISASAKEKIEKAGGSITPIPAKVIVRNPVAPRAARAVTTEPVSAPVKAVKKPVAKKETAKKAKIASDKKTKTVKAK